VFKIPPKARRPLRVLAVAMSAGLFAYLIWRAGPSKLWENVVTLGWGFTWVIALAGVSHLAKTWAWQLTLGEDKHKVSFPLMLGLRLGSEAAGQLGILGQTFGDSIRVSHLSPEIRTASGLASVTLDRGLYIVTGAMITIAGIVAALPVLSLSRTLRLYAGLFVVILIAFLLLALLGVRKRWPVLSGSARIIGRVPFLKNWMEKEYLLIQSVENTLLDFHHNMPKAFWVSFSLNLACHCMAVLEVCLVLWLMKIKLRFFGALVVEAFTKIVNVMGNINPGNIGTYEGGNMLIGKMFGLNVATGLVLGLARRLRSLIWAAVGIICLFLLTRPRRRRDSEGRGSTAGSAPNNQIAQADPLRSFQSAGEAAVVILIANEGTNSSEFEAPLARVGTLPILLRTILAAQKLSPSRIVVVLDPINRRRVQRDLFFTGRLPESVQWIETAAGTSLVEQLRLIATQSHSERLVLIEGNTTYHSSLLRKASEWNNNAAALALTSGDNFVGIHALTVEMIRRLAEHSPAQISTLEDLHAWLAGMYSVVCMPVAESWWQRVCSLEDRMSAEQKLNGWLVKPTDGIYARLNRRISIPVSRQLIKFPITPNMVSIFTLGVGFASATYFAFGGYWNTLLGAVLCLCASILDGCDGEVARLKLLESDFGCWLETMCDYLFYLFLFIGMTIGLWRSSGSNTFLALGGLLVFGAMASFFAAGWGRHRLATGRPEQLLGIWQTHAESRPSNPFLYMSRHTEFIIRRCFFPYALLFFALFNIINVAFVLSAIGANLVWPIALYSSRTFAGSPRAAATSSARLV
jgi:phosphatidylglycerophosphate synthase